MSLLRFHYVNSWYGSWMFRKPVQHFQDPLFLVPILRPTTRFKTQQIGKNVLSGLTESPHVSEVQFETQRKKLSFEDSE